MEVQQESKPIQGTLHILICNTDSWLTAEIIDECRQACGGHGYSSYAGLSSLYQDFVVQNTWEVQKTEMMCNTCLGR